MGQPAGGVKTAVALRDKDCVFKGEPFIVPPGCTASNFTSRIDTNFEPCAGPEIVKRITFSIREKNTGLVVYEGTKIWGGTSLEEKMGPLSKLLLGAGTYELLLDSGRNTTVTLSCSLSCPKAGTVGKGEILFQEDFNDGSADGFGNEAGRWIVGRADEEEKIYYPSDPVPKNEHKICVSSFGNPEWQDYSVEADFLNAVSGGIVIRARNDWNVPGILVHFITGSEGNPGFISLSESFGSGQFGECPLEVKKGQNMHVKVDAIRKGGTRGGDLFKVYVDGELKCSEERYCISGENDKGKVFLYIDHSFDMNLSEDFGITREMLQKQAWDNIVVKRVTK
jgi:hypothetical protein